MPAPAGAPPGAAPGRPTPCGGLGWLPCWLGVPCASCSAGLVSVALPGVGAVMITASCGGVGVLATAVAGARFELTLLICVVLSAFLTAEATSCPPPVPCPPPGAPERPPGTLAPPC